jgi:Sulfotransferase family
VLTEPGDTTCDASATTMPNFLIIGAAKAGTTSIWRQLRQHPQIYMHPKKQVNFFALKDEDLNFRGPAPRDSTLHSITTIEAYRAQFSGVTDEVAVGEASNLYLYSPRAAERIRHYVPDVKLIAILRHPADRAYSRFLHLVREGREPITDFAKALEEEEARIHDRWYPDFHYLRVGLYYAQLKRYFDLFPREQIKVYLQEDLKSDPYGLLRDVFQFLEVDDTFIPDITIKYNVSGIPKNRSLHVFLQKLRSIRPYVEWFLSEGQRQRILRVASDIHNRNLTKPQHSPEVRRQLIERYRDDTLKLQHLIQRDLSAWLE